jgi:hypothetical protein
MTAMRKRQLTITRTRHFGWTGLLTVAVVATLVAAASGQGSRKYTTPKTPWGDPDLQGVWNDATSTPLQRPASVGEKDVLSDEEAEDFQKSLAFDLSRDRRDGGNAADVNRAYNEHWMDARRLKITADRRTSLIVDPVDGRIPTLATLPADRQRVRASRAESAARFAAGLPDNYTDMSWPVRCVVRTDVPPYLPTIYNNNFQIFQSPGYVTIAPEMIHSARIIPVDGRPHLQGAASVARRYPRSLGRLDARRRNDELQGRGRRALPGRQSRDVHHHRAFHARGGGRDQLRVHRCRSDDVVEAVDRADSVEQGRSRRADVRVRLSRRQFRHRALPDGRQAPRKEG